MVGADILSRFSSESSEMPELDPDGRTFQRERRVPPLNVTCRSSTKRTYKITQVASSFLFFFFSPLFFWSQIRFCNQRTSSNCPVP